MNNKNVYEYEIVVRRVDGNEITCEDNKIINELNNDLWEASCVISSVSQSFDAERNTSIFIVGHVKVEETNDEDNFENIICSKMNSFLNKYHHMKIIYRKSTIL